MLNNNKLFDFANEYQIHELVFINSGSNYYVRLPVNNHAALISDNNSGKTSSLSALKLFLLPETSFKKQKNKFGFRSGGTYYADLSSYTYYFPSSESYIICNASNPKGRFCWVLYRTTDLSYERIAVPYDYEAIEHLFWDSSSDKNEKAGKLYSQITISTIKKQLTKKFNGKIYTERKSIGDAIYTRTSVAKEDSQYCLLPMTRGFSASITETIRSLLNIAFSLSDASTTSLPMAIGSILDSAGMSAVKKGSEEGIFLDLDSQLQEWEKLKSLDSHLQLVASHQHSWEKLQSSRIEFGKLKGRCINNFKNICWSLHKQQSELQQQQNTNSMQVHETQLAIRDYQPIHQSITNKYNEAKSTIKSNSEMLEKIESNIQRVSFVRGRLSPLCPNEEATDATIIQVLDDQIDDAKSEIAGLKDSAKILEQMQQLNNNIKQQEAQREQLNTTITQLDTSTSLLDNLANESASILLSLNQDFAKLSVTPSNQHRQTAETFTSLFSQTDGQLLFCGEPLPSTIYRPHNKQIIQTQLNKEIEELDAVIKNNKGKLTRFKKNCELSKESQRLKLQESEIELAEMNEERNALSAANMLETQRSEILKTLEHFRNKFQELSAEKTNAEARRNQLNREYSSARERFDEQAVFLQKNESHLNQLNRIEAHSRGLLNWDDAILEFDTDRTQLLPLEQLQSKLSALELELNTTLEKQLDYHKTMDMLLVHGVIKVSPEERHQITQDATLFEQRFTDLQTVYLNLEQSREDYRERLAHHNNTAATASRMIENVNSIVTNFVKSINNELKGYQISNLNSVELVADLHPQYVDMIRTLNRIGSRNDQLLPETFYKQIGNFQDQFYVKNPGKIDISKIIEKINYRFERNNDAEDNPQSNGTNSMLNSVLLALLLKRLVPEDLNLSMPVVFDEVGSLDERNLREVLKVMTEHNMYLFAANPEQTGVIASVLDIYHNLSVFKVTDVEFLNKAEAIYYPGMEERLEGNAE